MPGVREPDFVGQRQHFVGGVEADERCPRCPRSILGRLKSGSICVIEEVGALWALERGGSYRGRYHVLGALLSALDGRGPEALRVNELVARAQGGEVREIILALPATVDGQTTAHYLSERLSALNVQVTSLARGVPVGGELDWLDDGTIATALRARRPA